MTRINITVQHGDALEYQADVLVLKYAQAFYGLDEIIQGKFQMLNSPIDQHMPKIWQQYTTESKNISQTRYITFIGVPDLINFDYKEIRQFSYKALNYLALSHPDTQSIIFTLHGPGYGLDESEAFKSLVAGFIEGIANEDAPKSLEKIIIVEKNEKRADRLQALLNLLTSKGGELYIDNGGPDVKNQATAESFRSAGIESETKAKIFVAMPFAKEFDDTFHYGIQGAGDNTNYLCERSDLESYVGDVIEFVKRRIARARFIIADLTTGNPNVYLEIGYAWGLNKKTILVIKEAEKPKFDVQGQRYLAYSSIKDLEEKLTKEIKALER